MRVNESSQSVSLFIAFPSQITLVFLDINNNLPHLFTDIPEAKPFIDGIMARYRPGDELRGNCSSQFSKPAANLTWMVNDLPVSMEN